MLESAVLNERTIRCFRRRFGEHLAATEFATWLATGSKRMPKTAREDSANKAAVAIPRAYDAPRLQKIATGSESQNENICEGLKNSGTLLANHGVRRSIEVLVGAYRIPPDSSI
eukprot:2694003-Rhodomonas_salina.1